jgi:hypothetical protein
MTHLLGVRREDGRTVWLAFATLLTIVAAHSVLETGRDALFLTHLSVRMLPWAYLGMAVVAFVATAPALVAGRAPRRLLAGLLVVVPSAPPRSGGSSRTPGTAALMALYVDGHARVGGRRAVLGGSRRAHGRRTRSERMWWSPPAACSARCWIRPAGAILHASSGPRALVLAAAAMFVVACVPALGTTAIPRCPRRPCRRTTSVPGSPRYGPTRI